MKHKVLAYITRRRNGRTQLLVFTHRDFPEAGVQVPAGTVEPDEPVEAALFREVHEESGLT
ncbi:MAG TPA: NUDIX domain-containing protein, partial [Anaerolineales bacterium]|nr:NUDIX domain-containing protein [Anaerolineales bacterium]